MLVGSFVSVRRSFVFVGRLVVSGLVVVFLFVCWAPNIIPCIKTFEHLLNDDLPSIVLVDGCLLCVVSVT